MRKKQISVVYNAITIVLFNKKSLPSQSLRKYLLSMVPLVAHEVISELPERFRLLFDGWSDASWPYLEFFETYFAVDKYHENLLAFYSFLQEDDMGSEQNLALIHDTLDV